MNRYNRHIILSDIGKKGQDKISNAKVLVIGAGGLGCPILQYLVAAGVGTIGIIDFDVVEISNLQRQILFGTSSIGLNKALAAKKRLEDLNPTITINAHPDEFTPINALYFFECYDIIVDATDNFETRYLINDASILTNKPVVYGAIYKFEGQVSVFNYKNGPSYRCLFPTPPKEGSIANCSEIGVLGVLPGIIGTMQANEVLKIILEFDQVLTGELLCYNAKAAEIVNLKITKSDSEIEKVISRGYNFQIKNNTTNCGKRIIELSMKDVFLKDNIQFIDVREQHEKPKLQLPNCIQIPLGELEQNLNQFNSNKNNIIFCQTGVRSRIAVERLQKHNINNCYSLKEDVSTIIEQLNITIK